MRGRARFRLHRRGVLLAGALTLSASSAFGAPSPADRVLAESLFQEARDLMNADRVPEACAKFAESYRLDSTLGTLLNLAVCHEKEGKIASAWAEFKDAASMARANHQPDRDAMATKHAESLQGQLSYVVLLVPE